MIRKLAYAVLLVGLAICLSPMAAVIYASWFANRHGCTLHEGFVNPCVVNGVDHGETLYTLFVSGWFMLLTLPAAVILVVILLVMMIRGAARRRRA